MFKNFCKECNSNIYPHLSVRCNYQQYTSIATFPVTFSTNHLWLQVVDWSHPSHKASTIYTFHLHLHLLWQPSFKTQRKQFPPCCMISPCAFGLSLPNCWAIFCPPVFCHTQKNHPFIPVPIFHLQLTKGHFYLTKFSLGNLSNLPLLCLPQSVTPVTLSNCNSRAVLKHFTPILEMFSSSFLPHLV